jgi:hypothetical protein
MANNNPSANIPKGYWPPKNKGHKTPTIFLDRALDIDITSHRLSESFEKVDFSNLDSKTGRVVLNTIGFGDKVKSMPSESLCPGQVAWKSGYHQTPTLLIFINIVKKVYTVD